MWHHLYGKLIKFINNYDIYDYTAIELQRNYCFTLIFPTDSAKFNRIQQCSVSLKKKKRQKLFQVKENALIY